MFLSGKSHGQRNLAGCSPWGHPRVGHDLATKQQLIVYICKSQTANSSHPVLPALVSIHVFSTSVSVSAMQKCKSKWQWGIISHWSNGHHQKNLQAINAGENVERRDASCTVDVKVNGYSPCGEQYGSFLAVVVVCSLSHVWLLWPYGL